MCRVQLVKVRLAELVVELLPKLPGQVVVAENRNGIAIFTFGLANYFVRDTLFNFFIFTRHQIIVIVK